MLRLVTFGGLALERLDSGSAPRLRPQRLAILAVLAVSGDRGVSREWMAALFWPDADEDKSRHALRQALYALRQELGLDVLKSDSTLVLDRARLCADIAEFRAALSAGDRARAAELVNGPFLHGFALPAAPEVERWIEEQRSALAAESTRVIMTLAKEADAARDYDVAIERWRRLTTLDPLSGRFAAGYLKALAARGDRAGALAFARAHEALVRRELESDPDPDIRRLEAELRAIPAPMVARTEPASVTEPAERPAQVITGVRQRRGWGILAAALVVATIVAALLAARAGGGKKPATFAVGMIREDGVPDTLRIGGVLTDMLATNLARVAGLSVLANSRLFELMLPGQDSLVTGYSDAARRAGATEILQGRLLSGPQWGMAMEIQRVDLTTGLVKGAYRVSANDRYALIDSMTAWIARDLKLGVPTGSVADATTDSPIAYRLYEEGLRAYFHYDNDAARRLMQAALEEDSEFAMAAYYDALLVPSGTTEIPARERALRLASRAPERERLRIRADLLALNMDPAALAVAESLTVRYPNDPRSFELLSSALWFHGDWRAAVTAIERAIVLDSASELSGRQNCRLCDDFARLADIYAWWDSLPAMERTAARFLRSRPTSHGPWDILVRVAATRGDTAAVRSNLRRFHEASPGEPGQSYTLERQTLAENYEEVERDVRPMLESPRRNDVVDGRWIWSIVLRNQGRLAQAMRVAQQHAQAGFDPERLLEALVALESGDARRLVAILAARSRRDENDWPPGVKARHITWSKTLYGMALAAAGDTLALRSLADTVEYWGARSIYGRDRRLHHYLRGMLLVARNRDREAVAELSAAIHSPSNGFTRVNYELGKALLRLDRPADAVPVLRSGLHGGIDGSNLYVTRTELHELLAQALERLGKRDSAAVHYRAVVQGWSRSDLAYRERLDRARVSLAAMTDTRLSQR
jgi:DNA-binding SARP family transcriptional activator/tetratricopeptide (TPR) repeat protein